MERTRLEVATAAADAYLTLLAAQQTRIAAEGAARTCPDYRPHRDALGAIGPSARRRCVAQPGQR